MSDGEAMVEAARILARAIEKAAEEIGASIRDASLIHVPAETADAIVDEEMN